MRVQHSIFLAQVLARRPNMFWLACVATAQAPTLSNRVEALEALVKTQQSQIASLQRALASAAPWRGRRRQGVDLLLPQVPVSAGARRLHCTMWCVSVGRPPGGRYRERG